MRNHTASSFVLRCFLMLASFAFAIQIQPAAAQISNSAGEGRNQLVDALDAAYIRVLSSGKWREITKPLGRLVVNIADCYPTPDVAPFPENPTGILARILNERQIKVGSYIPSETGSTGLHFEANRLLLEAIVNELELAYGLDEPIEIVRVIIDPPSSTFLYNALRDGTIDITDLFSALGGSNFNTLRRKFARFTCTILASGWFLHVRDDAPYESIDDFQADSTAVVCNVIMSTHLSRAYFPQQKKKTFVENDIELCSQGVLDGLYDAYLHFDPVPVKTGLRSIDTGIVSGTPIWVAGDNNTDTDTLLQIDTCEVKAGKNGKGDSINFLGSIDATTADFTAANNVIVTIDADEIPDLNNTKFDFPVEEDYLKEGKYKSPKVKPEDKSEPVTSLQIDTVKGKIKFSGKNLDLTGLGCPITITIQIGDYVAEAVLYEDIVNGPKKPCPPELMR